MSHRNTFLYLEYPALELSAPLAIVTNPIVPSGADGKIDVPQGPGLGLEFDDAALERLAVESFVVGR